MILSTDICFKTNSGIYKKALLDAQGVSLKVYYSNRWIQMTLRLNFGHELDLKLQVALTLLNSQVTAQTILKSLTQSEYVRRITSCM
jgi:hypothetical protein